MISDLLSTLSYASQGLSLRNPVLLAHRLIGLAIILTGSVLLGRQLLGTPLACPGASSDVVAYCWGQTLQSPNG